MKSKIIKKQMAYTGKELASHWAYRNFGIAGNSILAFEGPCEVGLQDMLDIEDVRNDSPIFSKLMLHFIIEHFDMDLEKAILRQRLLTAIIADCINKGKKTIKAERRGDDLFFDKRKLSVSIAAVTPVSTMIHFGINIDPKGAPVPAAGLKELGIKPGALAKDVIARYIAEIEGIAFARVKVRATR